MGFEVYDELSYLKKQQEQTAKNLKIVVRHLQDVGLLPEGIVKRASEEGSRKKKQ
jgi:CTP synthase (UTP-ammonia lyase)